MQTQPVHPATFFALYFPAGISSGYVTITLPFILARAGFPLGVTGAIVALGVSGNIWSFVGSPVVDLTLTLKRWYTIGLLASMVTLVALSLATLEPSNAALIGTWALLSQIGAVFGVLSVPAMIAHHVAPDLKGRAAGWYQGGNLAGTGIGGGAGVWLATHTTVAITGLTLACAMLCGLAALRFVPDRISDAITTRADTVASRWRAVGRDFVDMIRQVDARFVAVLVMSPIGIGAVSNLWSAVAGDWGASANRVALATGVGYGISSMVGCVVGGVVADRLGRWQAFFGAGTVMAAVMVLMYVAPRSPDMFVFGVIAYGFTQGLGNAAFSALILFTIGRGAATTKYSILSSLGNVPFAYMTAIDGRAHDLWGASGLLLTDAVLGAGFMLPALAVLWVLSRRRNSGRSRTLTP